MYMRLRCGILASLVGFAAAAFGQSPAVDAAVTADYVIALVNSDPITDGDLRSQVPILERQLREQGRKSISQTELRETVLERLINERLQLQLAQQFGMRADDAALDQAEKTVAAQNQLSVDALRQNLQRDGIQWVNFRRQLGDQIVLGRLREREVDARVKVSEQDIDRALAEQEAANASLANQTINAAQILITLPEQPTVAQKAAAQDKAKAIGMRLARGESFEALVSELSDGDRKNGGQLGLRRADRYPDLFVAALQDLPVGGVSKPVLSAAGLHILKLLERRASASVPALTQTRARHILLLLSEELNATQALARLEDIRKAINTRQSSFEAAARSYSQDGSATQGGDLGWASPGMFVPEFEQAMDRLREGEIGAPIVSRFGAHLIQVLERRRSELTIEQQRELIRKQLRAQKLEERFVTWLSELRARAFIEIREADTNPRP
jgi:peptidyl-prolyl cis-trans isomerase SurA